MVVLLGNKENSKEFVEFVKSLGAEIYFPENQNKIQSLLQKSTNDDLLILDEEVLNMIDKEALPKIHGDKFSELVVLFRDETPEQIMSSLPSSLQYWHLVPEQSSRILDTLKTVYDNSSFSGNSEPQPDKVIAELEKKKTFTINKSSERENVINEILQYSEQLETFSGFADIIKVSADELMSNAFYNAPRDLQTGAALKFDRKESVELPKEKSVEIIIGQQNEFMWIFVKDKYGSLTNQAFSKSLIRALAEKTAITTGTGGAGLGLMMLYKYASQVVVNVKPQEFTVFGCQFLLTKRNKIFDNEMTSIHFGEQ